MRGERLDGDRHAVAVDADETADVDDGDRKRAVRRYDQIVDLADLLVLVVADVATHQLGRTPTGNDQVGLLDRDAERGLASDGHLPVSWGSFLVQ
jgi:hypothetical protein